MNSEEARAYVKVNPEAVLIGIHPLEFLWPKGAPTEIPLEEGNDGTYAIACPQCSSFILDPQKHSNGAHRA